MEYFVETQDAELERRTAEVMNTNLVMACHYRQCMGIHKIFVASCQVVFTVCNKGRYLFCLKINCLLTSVYTVLSVLYTICTVYINNILNIRSRELLCFFI